MDPVIEQMLTQHDTATVYDKKNAIKEVVQELVLCGLSRAGFFKTAAFYGGTALRLFCGLDRFSEDLDFSLKTADPLFDLAAYRPTLEKEIRSYGLDFKMETKAKTAKSDIKSAFIKGNTKEHLLIFYPDEKLADTFNINELIKVKIEVDTNPPDFAGFELQYRLLPLPYEITLYDTPSLFAGKIHAVLCRGWKNRVKGRDLYDYVFYLSKGSSVNLAHLTARLAQTGHLLENEKMTVEDIKTMLCKRFAAIDYVQAKRDVEPFIKNPAALDIWSAEFFASITQNLTADNR